jgi:hypothetical protein
LGFLLGCGVIVAHGVWDTLCLVYFRENEYCCREVVALNGDCLYTNPVSGGDDFLF